MFLDWGQRCLPDLLDSIVDGEAEPFLDNAFFDLAKELPRTHLLHEIDALRGRVEHLRQPQSDQQPHRPAKPYATRPRASRSSLVRRLMGEQKIWQEQVRQMKWIPPSTTAGIPCIRGPDQVDYFLFIHLFSGRRRNDDFHMHLQQMLERDGIRCIILSLDTANLVSLGDLRQQSETWHWVQHCWCVGGTSV